MSDAMTVAELRPMTGEPDHRFAGTPLDAWRGYQPEDSVTVAIEMAVKTPNTPFIAFVVELPDEAFRTYIDHQRRAVAAYAAQHYPGIAIKGRTETVPFRGVGSDVRAFFVVAGSERKRDK